MNNSRITLLVFYLFCISSCFISLKATDTLSVDRELSETEMQLMWAYYVDSIEQTLKYETGIITLKDGIATIDVPENFKYLNAKDSDMVLTDLWGNPPSEGDGKSLGMLIPIEKSPMSDSSFCINITYSTDGYIDDKDAKDIDYDDLLKTMKEDTKASSDFRVENGYESIELVGWASPPYYDSNTKKLHWAKELKFGGVPVNTLNYNIRILGRKGFLELNAISDIFMLETVKAEALPILPSVNFTNGNTYGDFNPDIDQVAAYGVGGLIAGKALVKAGVFAKLGVLLAKFGKFLLVGIIALFAGAKSLFRSGKNNHPDQVT